MNAETAAGRVPERRGERQGRRRRVQGRRAFAIARGAQPVAPAAERGGVGGTVEATEGTGRSPQRKSALTLLGGAAA